MKMCRNVSGNPGIVLIKPPPPTPRAPDLRFVQSLSVLFLKETVCPIGSSARSFRSICGAHVFREGGVPRGTECQRLDRISAIRPRSKPKRAGDPKPALGSASRDSTTAAVRTRGRTTRSTSECQATMKEAPRTANRRRAKRGARRAEGIVGSAWAEERPGGW